MLLSKEVFEKHYFEERLTHEEIAKKYAVSQAWVSKLAKKYGIKRLNRQVHNKKISVDKAILFHEYLGQNMSQKEIGAKYGVSHAAVGRLLKKYGIEGKNSSDYCDVVDKRLLEKWYVQEKLTYKQIAEKLNKSEHFVQRNIKLHDIQSRPSYNSLGKPCSDETAKKISLALKGKKKSEEHRKKISLARSGSNNPNFGKPSWHANRCWYFCPDGIVVSMRSNWEVAYAEWLNLYGIKWEYEPKTFLLQDGSAYTPDFYLVETDEYIEVKGWFRDEHKTRIEKFRQTYPTCKLTIADKAYLENIGIDLKQNFISTRPKFSCEQCGDEFYRIYKTQRMCSRTCRNRYIASHRSKD